jgi:hypothetical protein
MTSPLAGKRVLVTRERPGELGAMLEARGATVVHVPLIEIREPADGGEHLRRELGELRNFDWLVVTSVRVPNGSDVRPPRTRRVSLAAVGSATARVLADLAGRPRRPAAIRPAGHGPRRSPDRALSRRSLPRWSPRPTEPKPPSSTG